MGGGVNCSDKERGRWNRVEKVLRVRVRVLDPIVIERKKGFLFCFFR